MFAKNSVISPFFQYILYFLILLIAGLFSYYMIYIGNRAVKKENQININWNSFIKLILGVLFIVCIVSIYKKFTILQSTTFALFLSILLAFLLNPIVGYLEKKGVKRGLGTIITYISILFIIVFLFVSIIPELVLEITSLFTNLPSSFNYVYEELSDLFIKWNIDTKILSNLRNQLNDYLIQLANTIPERTSTVIAAIQNSISSLVTIILVPLITYYLSVDKDKIINKIYNLIPKRFRHDSLYLYKEINFTMNEFVRNRLLMAVFIGFATGFMLTIFGIPFSWAIGFLTMILDIVPYIGPILATVPALIFAFIKSPLTFFWVFASSMILQWIEQNIIGTKLFSSTSGIHEIVILLSIIIGGGIMGVWGMILSVPIVLLIKILFEYFTLKLKGIKPEFTKDKEREIMLQIKKAQKERRKNNSRKIYKK